MHRWRQGLSGKQPLCSASYAPALLLHEMGQAALRPRMPSSLHCHHTSPPYAVTPGG